MTNPAVWFEIPVTDLERATTFYETLLEIKTRREDVPGYQMVWLPSDHDGRGVSGALMKGDGYQPRRGSVIYFHCPDIDAALERATTMGVQVMLPKKAIGEFGYIAWVWDTEGNVIGLHTPK